jgi:hypothetical protein
MGLRIPKAHSYGDNSIHALTQLKGIGIGLWLQFSDGNDRQQIARKAHGKTLKSFLNFLTFASF